LPSEISLSSLQPLSVDSLLRKTGELRFLINYRRAAAWKYNKAASLKGNRSGSDDKIRTCDTSGMN